METKSWLEQKEDDMPQKVSKYEQFFVDKGEKIGEKRGEKRGIDNTHHDFYSKQTKTQFF